MALLSVAMVPISGPSNMTGTVVTALIWFGLASRITWVWYLALTSATVGVFAVAVGVAVAVETVGEAGLSAWASGLILVQLGLAFATLTFVLLRRTRAYVGVTFWG